ncbi:hypothetical protein M4578_14615 [Salipiger sp. P9]|uniref:hypothetical protein n=1 Tax=Salipiger pentaromativorans TaxID=2943193 RepID=UPI0021579D91|nr:hypothetical protein [Salipiger pentaromativorans]MCR8549068.1 hypothetical protein [Salipiger pentaromativorans]
MTGMTREAFVLFTLCFVAGPLLFALLMRFGQSLTLLLALALGVVSAVLLALLLQDRGALLVSLGMLWLAWVLAVAMVALTLRRRLPPSVPRRWVIIAGLLATTLPWFGLATARSLLS